MTIQDLGTTPANVIRTVWFGSGLLLAWLGYRRDKKFDWSLILVVLIGLAGWTMAIAYGLHKTLFPRHAEIWRELFMMLVGVVPWLAFMLWFATL
jgi:CHASE1-domain containing sensor protein